MRRWLLLVLLSAPAVWAQERASLVSKDVKVVGEVRNELVLGVVQLREMAQRRGRADGRGYGGLLLVDLLREAEIRQDARNALRRTYVVARSTDGYVAVFSWGELFNSPVGAGVIIAFERDGQPLRDGEGDIALVSVADERPGVRHVKWLSRIEVRRVME